MRKNKLHKSLTLSVLNFALIYPVKSSIEHHSPHPVPGDPDHPPVPWAGSVVDVIVMNYHQASARGPGHMLQPGVPHPSLSYTKWHQGVALAEKDMIVGQWSTVHFISPLVLHDKKYLIAYVVSQKIRETQEQSW